MSTYYGDTSVVFSGVNTITNSTSVGSSTNIGSAVGGALNVSGDLTMGGSKTIHFAQGTDAAPSFTTRSTGTKLVLYPSINGSNVDYALGIESGALWSSVQSAAGSFKWYAGTTQLMQLASTSLTVDAPEVIDVTSTEALLVRKNSDGGDVFTVDTTVGACIFGPIGTNYVRIVSDLGINYIQSGITGSTGSVAPLRFTGINATPIFAELSSTSLKLGPGAGIQNSLLSLYGTASNAAQGPHILATTTADAYPVFQLLNFAHDAIALNFDSYGTTSNWISSHFGSNFQIYKVSNSLQFNHASSVSAGSVVPWSTAMSVANTGRVSIENTSSIGNSTNITSATGGSLNVYGDLTMGAAKSIHFPSTSLAAPSFTTRSAGTRIVLYPTLGASDVDFAIGMMSGAVWHSVGDLTNWFAWYHETTETMRLSNTALTLEATQIIDVTSTEALLVRKNADAKDIFTVDSSNESVRIDGRQSSTVLSPFSGTLTLGFDGGSGAGGFGSSLVFTQKWNAGTQTQVGVGQISGVKIAGDGSFGGGLAFFTSDLTTNNFAERMRILDNGNVAIGSISASQKLSVVGNAAISDNLQLYGTTSIPNTTNITSATSGGILTVLGDMTINSSKTIHFAQGGAAAPTFTTRSAGTKIVLYPNLSGSAADFAMGMDTNTMWSSVGTSSQFFRWYGGTTQLMELTGTGLTLDTPEIIDVTSTTALVARKNAAGGDVLAVDTTNTSLKLGPGAGIQNQLLSLYGTQNNTTLGPHLMCTTTQDTYPTFQLLNYAHNNVTLTFDGYYASATSDWRSSSFTSHFSISKSTNLDFLYSSSVSAGSIVTWTTGMSLSNAGVLSTRTILPSTTNAYNLGSASFQWQNVFSQNAVTVSDERQKKDIIPERFGLDFINKLRPVEYTYKSTNSRAHGLIAQEVEQVVQNHGIDTSEFYMYDQDADIYNMKYMELTSPLIKSIQELTQRILQLELQLAKLQA
jgi:hypothetical protein